MEVAIVEVYGLRESRFRSEGAHEGANVKEMKSIV